MRDFLSTGKKGEKIAVDYLQKNNYHIIEINFRTRAGEIDIVAQKKETFVFCEVKTRIDTRKGKPYESVTYRKLHRLKKAIYYYLMKKKIGDVKARIDVISIECNPDLTIKKLQHFENVVFPAL